LLRGVLDELGMILDNYGTHTHDNVVAWLDKHPRYHLHFIPTPQAVRMYRNGRGDPREVNRGRVALA
jgi:hypothetical protein